MSIKEIRAKKLKDLTRMELEVLKQDCVRLINYSDNPRTIYQEKKYLEKIINEIRRRNNG